MLKKILNLKKKPTDFFLELNEEESSEEASSQIQATVATPTTQQEQTEVSSSDVEKAKGRKKGKKAQETIVFEQPAPPKQSYDNVEQLIINAVYAKKSNDSQSNSENGSQSEKIASNFATDYLISAPAPNRRPGASMNKFKEMSRTLKSVTKIRAQQ